MPLVEPSSYAPPLFLANGHVQTIYPVLFRTRPKVRYQRERMETEDGDFVDLDWSTVGSERLVVICHGLEGCSLGIHELGMVKALNEAGWDAMVMNFRGCSGEINRAVRFYHSGETGDLRRVIGLAGRRYAALALVGLSLGGNVVLTYLGQRPEAVDSRVGRVAVFSVPCDLAAGATHLDHWSNRIYLRRFIKSLTGKVMEKAARMPGRFDLDGIGRIRGFKEFDDRYTAPIHGFENAEEYWRVCSSRQYLAAIRRPTLLVNARNDPFLPPECFPTSEAEASEWLYLETPASGGHNGFVTFNSGNRSWAESRAVEFLGGL